MKITFGILVLTIFGLSLSSYSQYNQTLKENSEWYTYSWFEISYNTAFHIIGDSVINDTTYKKLGSFPTGQPPSNFHIDLVREDSVSKSIYRRANGIDYLMYDFTLEPGDTFSIKRMDGGFLHNLLLDSITNTVYNNTGNLLETNIDNMRVFYFHDPEFTYIDNVIWIEGIGSLTGLIYSDLSWNGGNNGETLLCHYNELGIRDFHFIYNEEPFPCQSVVGINEIETENKIKISPNPSMTGIFKLGGQDIKSVSCYNSVGKLISNTDFDNNETITIDLSNNPNGVYFIRVLFMDKTLTFNKIMKTNSP